VFALNNDYDKVDKDGRPDNRGQKKAEKLAAAYRQRGYKVKNQVPINVDFDDDLMCYRRHGALFGEPETPPAAQQPVADVPPRAEEAERDEEEWLP